MAKCDICGKSVTFGIQVSHSHRRSNRTWKPNIRRVKAVGPLIKRPFLFFLFPLPACTYG